MLAGMPLDGDILLEEERAGMLLRILLAGGDPSRIPAMAPKKRHAHARKPPNLNWVFACLKSVSKCRMTMETDGVPGVNAGLAPL